MGEFLPLVTGKAAPEHRCHSVSSLFRPEKIKKEGRKMVRPANYQIWATIRSIHYRISDYLFVHFNVQPVGHFIVLKKIKRQKKTHYNKLKLCTFCTFLYTYTQSKNPSIYSTQCWKKKHTHVIFRFVYMYYTVYVDYVLRNLDGFVVWSVIDHWLSEKL